MGSNYSLYLNNAAKVPSNVCIVVAVPNLLYGIHLSEDLINGIQEVYLNVWKKPVASVTHLTPNIVEFKTHKLIMVQGDNAKNSAKAKQMFCRFHKLFSANGCSLVNSPTLTFTWSLSSWFYVKEINPYMINTGSTDDVFCAISLSGTDRFQFLDFPPELESGILDCLKNTWRKGIKDREPIEKVDNGWTIQLNGTPWNSHDREGLEARFVLLTLIRFMSHHNWRLVNSTAMKVDACDTMFFRKYGVAFNYGCPTSISEYYLMLALMGNDYFAVLGANENIKMTIASSCARHELKGIRSIEMKEDFPTIIMNSDVWSRRGEKEHATKRLMTLLFQDLAAIGWLPVESIDCSRSIEDLSSIAFVNIPPVRMMFFAMSPIKFNAISLVNAPVDVQNMICDTFKRYYPIEKEVIKMISNGTVTTINMPGNPFRIDAICILLFQQTLAVVVDVLKNAGWNLILSADTSRETKNTGGKNQHYIKYSIYSLWFGKVLAN